MYKVLNATRDWNDPSRLISGNFGHVLTFDTTCRLARKFGFSGINVDLHHMEAGSSLSDMSKLLEDYALLPVSFGFPVQLSGALESFEESLAQFAIEAHAADQLGCRLTLCYVPPFSDISFDSMFKRYTDRLRRVVPLLDKYNIKIAFEFIGAAETRLESSYDFIHTIDGIRSLISASDLDDYAGFKLDSHHWHYSGATTLDLYHLDIDHILYLELNDSPAGFDTLTVPEFDRNLPLTTGVIDLSNFLKIIYGKGFRGPIVAEPWNQALANMPVETAVEKTSTALDRCLEIAAVEEHNTKSG